MAYELKQEFKLSQKLLLTPQLQLAIKLLQLSRQELVDVIREEVEKNPVLDESVESEASAPAVNEEQKGDVDWESYIEHHDNSYRRGLDFSESDEDAFPERATESQTSLGDHLLRQLKLLGLGDEDDQVGEFIVGNIDDDGYLRVLDKEGMPPGMPVMDSGACKDATVSEIAALLGAEPQQVLRVLGIIQDFDPPGVGARTVAECLLIQARLLPVRDTLVEEIIENHLEKLAAKNFRAISKASGVEVEKVLEASAIITESLNPMPGAGFGSGEDRVILPDVYIQKVGDEYVVVLNEDGLPKLRISRYYKEMLRQNGDVTTEAKGYVRERLRSASWLIKSVYQRQRTIKKTVESIVKFQREFLDKGLRCLKPLVLKDVAEDIGMHESTISRVTSNKYVHTPRGIFELKYFFSSAMSKTDGNDTTAEYIREKMKTLLENEDETTPLSDQQLSVKLKELGIVVARRTVAKYREELGYMPSSKRRVRI